MTATVCDGVVVSAEVRSGAGRLVDGPAATPPADQAQYRRIGHDGACLVVLWLEPVGAGDPGPWSWHVQSYDGGLRVRVPVGGGS
jgi:hypothetical protein